MNSLWAISPIDGRYKQKTQGVEKNFSEGALILYRLKVEAHWLEFLTRHVFVDVKVPSNVKTLLQQWQNCQDLDACEAIKSIERTTNHDVKAVEYYIQTKLENENSEYLIPLVHFACTSEDINNCSYALMTQDFLRNLYLPKITKLETQLANFAREFRALPMLARTHGQPASPTTLGKEWANFLWRVRKQKNNLTHIPIEAKFNGAVGNFNAHHAAFLNLDWITLSQKFISEHLKLTPNPVTTQIENHDRLVELLDRAQHLNTILVGFCRDIWGYIAIGLFTQKSRENEVGSSTMPHKINPIDFENAEGNFGIANSLSRHLSEKLPISRFQRDLTDSTALRNLGVFWAHTMLALDALSRGLEKIVPNIEMIKKELENNSEVLAEAIQTVMRKKGVLNAYERLKIFTRGQKVSEAKLNEFIRQVDELSEIEKAELIELSPEKYIGKAIALTDFVLSECSL